MRAHASCRQPRPLYGHEGEPLCAACWQGIPPPGRTKLPFLATVLVRALGMFASTSLVALVFAPLQHGWSQAQNALAYGIPSGLALLFIHKLRPAWLQGPSSDSGSDAYDGVDLSDACDDAGDSDGGD